MNDVMDKSYKVYRHLLPMSVSGKDNDMVYIGMTCQEKPEYRWGKNGIKYKNSTYFWRAIKKYGWDSFKHDVLASNLSKEEAEEMERNLISSLKSYDRNYGYNIELGGNHSGKHSEETRLKISKAKIGYRFSEESKQKMRGKRPSVAGANNPMYGKHRSEETKRKLSEAHTGMKASEEARKKMSESRKGELNHMFGKTHTEEARQKIKDALGHKVMCIETGIVYESGIEAKRQTGIDNSCIQKCCKGKQSYAGKLDDGTKLHWTYYEEVV